MDASDRPDPATTGTGGPWSRLHGHEQVVIAADPATGLRAAVAVHSTALGPALGGTRMHAYHDEDAALADVLRLAEAMTLKNALAGLDHGGGKAVILGDPARVKTPDLLRSYGRLVACLGGRYVTACDVGTYVTDMDIVSEVCPWTTGRSPARGGAGDSGLLTAHGVLQGMRACAAVRWGSDDLAGRRVGIAGVGKVGRRLATSLVTLGARVVVADVEPGAVRDLRAAHPEIAAVASPADLVAAELDIYSPNALGGALTRAVAAGLRAEVVCGGANNQLAEPDVADLLAARGVLYAPDFMVNCGGVIQVADELHGFDLDRARARVDRVYDTTVAVLRRAADEGVTPHAAAERQAADRVAAAAASQPAFRAFGP